MELTAQVHTEDRSYWAEVAELPGCFASGATLDELKEALDESVRLYLADGTAAGRSQQAEIQSLKLVLPAG